MMPSTRPIDDLDDVGDIADVGDVGDIADVGDVGDIAPTDLVDGPQVAAAVALAPEPASASTARAWMAAVLDGWPPPSVDTAVLLVSELVTNAVLHARTEIGLRCRLEATRVRVEVTDGRRDGPLPKRYASDSPTGRGLRLVAALAAEWGVTRASESKTVWFVVTPKSDVGVISVAQVPTDAADADCPTTEALAPTGEVGDLQESVTVEILGIPLEVYVEAEQHNDAVMRELTLLLQTPPDAGETAMPARLLEIATEVRAMLATASTSMRLASEHALEQRQETMDLIVQAPLRAWQALLGLASQLEELDRFCESGHLLTLESPPRLRGFRRWYTRQVENQLRGLPATPWPVDTAISST